MKNLEEIVSKETLIIWLKENSFGPSGKINSNLRYILKKQNMEESFLYYTSFLEENCTPSERIYCLFNNVDSRINCKQCGEKVKFISIKNGYRVFCSKKCEGNYRTGKPFSEERCKNLSKSLTGKPKSEEHKKKLSDLYKGKTYEEIHGRERAEKIKKKQSNSLSGKNNPMYGKKLTEETKGKIKKKALERPPCSKETRKKISLANSGENNGFYGKHHTEETKLRIRELNKNYVVTPETCRKISEALRGVPKSNKENYRKAVIKRIENNYGICFPSYNKKACEYFKWLDEVNNTHGCYAMYGGGEYKIEQLGYFVDYINFEKYIIIEWDEEHHYKENKLLERDIQRQKEIEEYLPSFKFLRIRENEFNLESYTNIL